MIAAKNQDKRYNYGEKRLLQRMKLKNIKGVQENDTFNTFVE